jgi:F-box and WD-40 domain protein CDC4
VVLTLNSHILAVLKGHSQLGSSLVLVGDKLVSASADGVVRIWSMDDYTELHCIRVHEYAVVSLACDGTRILTGGADGAVKIWEIETGKPVREFVSRMNAIWKVGFTDDKAVAAYSKDGHALMEVSGVPLGMRFPKLAES